LVHSNHKTIKMILNIIACNEAITKSIIVDKQRKTLINLQKLI
jgi:hypothetical protein